MRKRCILGGKSSRFVAAESNVMRGLLSVTIVNSVLIMKSAKFSQAQVLANASFSICAYLASTSDSERNAKLTGRHVLSSCNCLRVAPSLYDKLSADNYVGYLGSYSASVGTVFTIFLRLLNAVS